MHKGSSHVIPNPSLWFQSLPIATSVSGADGLSLAPDLLNCGMRKDYRQVRIPFEGPRNKDYSIFIGAPLFLDRSGAASAVKLQKGMDGAGILNGHPKFEESPSLPP